MALSLIAFDTNHIKSYVFETDKLKEIRGASSLLDKLNRIDMLRIAHNLKIDNTPIKVVRVYTTGGSGLFLVMADKDKAQIFGKQVQQSYREQSKDRASITFAVQELPDHIAGVKTDNPDDEARHIQAIMNYDLGHELEMLRYGLREAKDHPLDTHTIALSAHPFMRLCDSCGFAYAEQAYQSVSGEPMAFYCASCREKQREDDRIKRRIPATTQRIKNKRKEVQGSLWGRILTHLNDINYILPADSSKLDRPNDFNDFRLFASKAYLGLIYADANNMGMKIEGLKTLNKIQKFASDVDENIHLAMSKAIKKHLPIVDIEKEGKRVPLFPFDILLLGGDDIVMVTEATKAMDVALTIAEEFRTLANGEHTLSIGVVLAPVKYPFALSWAMAESALKFAKVESAKARARYEDNDTRINFLTITGGSSSDFKAVFNTAYHKKAATRKNKIYSDADSEFYTTLRPFKTEDLQILLKAIQESKTARLNLGRTKLHQLREAVLEKNLTTAVNEGLALLRNWREKERSYVVRSVYEFGGRYQIPRSNPNNPASGFPRVTFPWFADGKNDDGQDIYRTPLLDFIELYDFVAREEEASGNEN